MRHNFINALVREISRTSIYWVRCYEFICLWNRANPVRSHAYQQELLTLMILKSWNSRIFALYTLLLLQASYTAENCNRKIPAFSKKNFIFLMLRNIWFVLFSRQLIILVRYWGQYFSWFFSASPMRCAK